MIAHCACRQPEENGNFPLRRQPPVVALAVSLGAREDEANFVAFVVARDFGEPDFVYSAALDGASYATASLASTDRAGAARLMATLSPAVQRDLAARRRWHEEHATFVRAIGAAMNGSYLRSNGVKDGVNSYGRVVSLMVAERRGGGL